VLHEEKFKKSKDITELVFINIYKPEIQQPVSGEHYDQVCLK